MPFAALACRLTAWFVLGAGAAGAAFFVRYDGLGVPIAVFIGVLAVALAVALWALGRVCAETTRIARALQPPTAAPSRWRPWRRRADRPAEAQAVPPAPVPTTPDLARPDAEDAELSRFFRARRRG